MKEMKLKQDEYKNIDIRMLNPNQFMKIKILPDSKVSEKEITNKDKSTWIAYSVKILHNGEEVWCKLTGAAAKKIKKAKSGEVYTIFAVPSELKGGKAYSVSLDEDEVEDLTSSSEYPMTQVDENNFLDILELVKKRGKTLDTIDDAMIIKVLTGHMGYTLEVSDEVCKLFWKYVKDNKLIV